MLGYGLSQSLTASEAQQYQFPEGGVLEPGGYLLIYLDRDTFDSPYHALFKLSSSGENLFLTHTRSSGVVELVEGIKVPALAPDTSYARVGAEFHMTSPTPMRPNGTPGLSIELEGDETIIRVVPETVQPTVLERSTSLTHESWQTLYMPIPGIEFDHRTPRQRQAFYRLRELQ